jgi:hypothetical protein
MEEVKAARQVRDSHLESMEAMVKRYRQAAYKGWDECDFAPENYEFEYTSLMVGKVCFANPRVKVKSRRPRTGLDTARGLRMALNQWGDAMNVVEPFQLAALDFLFNFGVLYTTQDPMPGTYAQGPEDVPPHWPHVCRLSQRQFLLDPLCGIFRQARYAGHEEAVCKGDLIEQAERDSSEGWNLPMLHELQTTSSDEFEWRPKADGVPDRDELRLCYLWCPHSTDEEAYVEAAAKDPDLKGYHGTIYTLVDGQGGKANDDWIRRPRAAYVPSYGPYALCGAYPVPDSPWPLGPLTAAKGRIDELNAHAVATSKAMAEYKRLVLVGNEALVDRLKKPDMFVLYVKGLNPEDVVQLEIGGLKPEHITALQILTERADRALAMNDARRGHVTGKGTATENALAAESGEVRVSLLKNRFVAAARQVYDTAARYMLLDDRVTFPLGEEAQQELGMVDPWWHGGAEGVDPDMFGYEIEPYSMDFTGSALERQQFIEALTIATQLAGQMPTMPHVNWRTIFGKFADVFNDSDWADFVDPDLAAAMGGLPAGQPGAPQPMMLSQAMAGMGGGKAGGAGKNLPAQQVQQGRMLMQASAERGNMGGRAAVGAAA